MLPDLLVNVLELLAVIKPESFVNDDTAVGKVARDKSPLKYCAVEPVVNAFCLLLNVVQLAEER